MALAINSNITSLNAQKNLNNTTNSLTKSMGRLSSGLRINSAKDDSAGLAISNKMSSQIRGMDQAARNANDGISMVQTAEGAMQEVSTNLQRIRELSVQASNASYSASDRESINNEVKQLVEEIDRVAGDTKYNGISLLDGSFGTKSIQIGANSEQTIDLKMTSVKSDSLGVGSTAGYSSTVSGGVTTGSLAVGDLTLNGYEVGATTADGVSFASGDASAISIANAINAVTGDTGVSASVEIATITGSAATSGTTAILSASTVEINGVSIGALGSATTGIGRASDMAAAINAISDQTGVTATLSGASVSLTSNDGRNITVDTALASGLTGLGSTGGATTTHSSVNLSSSSAAGIIVGGADEEQAGLTEGETAATVTASSGVSSLDLTTAAGASAAIDTVDAALANIDSARGELGAKNNRFESAISNLQNVSENTSAARSRIMDADFAVETAAMTKAQVMQQAGTAMLAQANQLPQAVLSLLG